MKTLKNLMLVLVIALTANSFAQAVTPQSDRQVGTLGEELEYIGTVVSMDEVGEETSKLKLVLPGNKGLIELKSDDEEVLSTLNDFSDTDQSLGVRGRFTFVREGERPRIVFVVESVTIGDRSIEGPTASGFSSVHGEIVGLGGPLMYHPRKGICVQSLTTAQTARLLSQGYYEVDRCPALIPVP